MSQSATLLLGLFFSIITHLYQLGMPAILYRVSYPNQQSMIGFEKRTARLSLEVSCVPNDLDISISLFISIC